MSGTEGEKKPDSTETPTPEETIPNPESSNEISMMVWDTLQVVFAPWMIPRIALRCSMLYALFVSSFVLAWELQVIMHGCISQVGEPYGSWKSYYSFYPDKELKIFVVVFATLLCLLGSFTIFLSKEYKMNPAARRAVLLTPTILIFPSHIWAFAVFVTAVNEPSFGFGGYIPEWIHWPILTFLGSGYWFFIGLITLVGVGRLNAFRATKLCRQKKLNSTGQWHVLTPQ